MSNRYRFSGVAMALVLALCAAGATHLTAQTGTVTGEVTAANVGGPVNGAQVAIEGTRFGSLSNATGRYVILNVPAGTYSIKIVNIGYGTQTKEITVTSGGTQVVDFALEVSVLGLDDIVVTGTAGAVERRKIGTSLPTLEVDAIAEIIPIDGFSQILEGRIPGVRSIGTVGGVGTGRLLNIRGTDSFYATAQRPVVYIDGVRVDTRAAEWGYLGSTCCAFSGGAGEDRLGDLNPDEIDRIEVLKGPAAATLFGSEASAGVIQVFTKRGRSNTPATFNLTTGFGLNRHRPNFPTTLRRNFSGPEGFVAWDPNETLIENGFINNYDLSVTGGGDDVTYFVAGGLSMEEGSVKPNDQTRANIRVNLNWTAAENVSVGVTSGYVRNRIWSLQSGNNWLGIYTNALLTNPLNATAEEPYGGGLDVNVADAQAIETYSDADRWTGSVNIQHTPMQNFRQELTVGLDAVADQKTRILPWGRYYTYLGRRGERNIGYRQARNFTGHYLGTVDYDKLFNMVTGSFSFGGQGYWDVTSLSMATGKGFAGEGVTTVSGASENQGSENFSEAINLGGFAQNRFDIGDDLFVTVAARMDGNSAFGDNFGFQFYPKADVAYNLPQSVLPSMFSNVKIRAAAGMAGKAPGAFAKFRTYAPTTVLDNKPGVTYSSAGNQDIEPENKREYEGGLDIGLFNNRIGMELTFYDALTTNALLYIAKPPSNGFGGRSENVGKLLNRGFESSVSAEIMDLGSFRWNMNVVYEWNLNEIVDLGETAIEDSIPIYENDEFIRWDKIRRLGGYYEGFPLQDIFYRQIIGWDAESRQHIRADYSFYQGKALPTHVGSVFNSFQLGQHLRLSVQFRGETGASFLNSDRGYGVRQLAYDEYLMHLGPDGSDTPASDSVLDRHRRAYPIDKRDHIRLQDVSLVYTIPAAISSRIGLERTTLTLSGYNLHWWDDCNCPDPNQVYSGGRDYSSSPFLGLPQPRKFLLSLRTRF